MFAFAASLAYLIAPLARGDPPRWVPVSFPLVAAILSALWSRDVYAYHREASYALLAAADRNACLSLARDIARRMKGAVAIAVLYLILIIYFSVASGTDGGAPCGHETCGADISWSAIVFGTAAGWFLTLRAAKRFYEARAASSSAVMEMPASAKVGVASVEVSVA